MDNFSAIYTFLCLSPSLYKQKQKQIWFYFCWSPTDKLSPTKMDFIFVGQDSQEKWKQFWRFHHVAKFALLNHVLSVLQYWYDNTASSMMTQSKKASSVRTVVSQVSGLTTVASTFAFVRVCTWAVLLCCEMLRCKSWKTMPFEEKSWYIFVMTVLQ